MGTNTAGQGWRSWHAVQLSVTPETWSLTAFKDPGHPAATLSYTVQPDGFTDPQAFADWAVAALSGGNLRLHGQWLQWGTPVRPADLSGEYMVGIGVTPAGHAWDGHIDLGRLPVCGARVPIVLNVASTDPPVVTALANYAPVIVNAYTVTGREYLSFSDSAMADLLYAVRRLREELAKAEDRIVVMWKDTRGDRLSWADLAVPLRVGRAAARERYLRIKSASKSGTGTQSVADLGMTVGD